MNNIIKTQMSLFHLSIMTGCAPEPEKPIDDLPLQSAPEILSAYYGLDKLPILASIPCGTDVEDKNGMPIVFSVQIDNLRARLGPDQASCILNGFQKF